MGAAWEAAWGPHRGCMGGRMVPHRHLILNYWDAFTLAGGVWMATGRKLGGSWDVFNAARGGRMWGRMGTSF
jgi:hypothetical protein